MSLRCGALLELSTEKHWTKSHNRSLALVRRRSKKNVDDNKNPIFTYTTD
jgi:hypothetical protein